MSPLLPFLLCASLGLINEPIIVAQEEDFATQVLRATVKIQHDRSTATGFVLNVPQDKSFLLVTAAHVLETTPGEETTLVFRNRVAEGVFKKDPLTVRIRKEGKPLWTQHQTEDVAVLRIVPPKSADLPVVSTELLASDQAIAKFKVHPGEDVFCLGYPHRVEANEAGFSILRRGPIASFPLVPSEKNKSFLLSTHCFEGDSGGPVCLTRTDSDKKDVRLILGLITGQHFLDEEMKMVYGSTKIRHRLGLAIVIQASFIRDTLGRLP